MTHKAIEVQSLIKKYPDLTAVNEITFAIGTGEIYAFLGPNGATTTIEILECLKTATSGTVRVLGMDIRNDEGKIKEHFEKHR